MEKRSSSIESDSDSGCQDVELEESDAILTSKNDTNIGPNLFSSLGDTMNGDEAEIAAVRVYFGNKVKVPENWHQLERREKVKILEDFNRAFFPNVPESLVANVVGAITPGDSGKLPSEVPDWLDKKKFERGQRFARDNVSGVLLAELLGLFTLYSFEELLKPVIMTGRSAEPYTSFKRFVSSAYRIRSWFLSDPWTKGTQAYNEMQTVRKLHNIVRKQLTKLSESELDKATKIDENRVMIEQLDIWLEDFKECCPVPKSGQCPYTLPILREARLKGLNQGTMGISMFGFVGLPILFPEAFGAHNSTYEDLDAFTHMWRGLGYLLGVEDEFNLCRGTFEETKQRCADCLEYFVKPNLRNITPEYEHMMRCVFEGFHFYLPGNTLYDSGLLHLTDMVGLKMSRLKASLSYNSWITYNLMYLIMYKLCRFGWFKVHFNRLIEASINKALTYNSDKHIALQKRSDKIIAKVLGNIAKKKSDITTDSLYRVLVVSLIITFIFLLVKMIWLPNLC